MTGVVGIVLAVMYLAIVSVPRWPGKVVCTLPRVRRHRPMWLPTQRRRHAREIDMGIILTEVATRLRSGVHLDRAWSETLLHSGLALSESEACHLDDYGVPVTLRKLCQLGPLGRMREGVTPLVLDALPSAIAVCRMGARTGAPMADILDSCAFGVTESMESRGARDIALAGPQSSAHMLALLPVVGVCLGYVMGADPLDFLLGSLAGRAVLIAGIMCEIAGVVFVRYLLRRAQLEDVL